MNIVPFKAEHIGMVDRQRFQQAHKSYELTGEQIEAAGDAITGLVGSTVVFCMGRCRQWEGRYILWALLSKDACKYMLPITRAAKRGLLLCEGRLELQVRSDFPAGRRWASILGFKLETVAPKFLPGGGDAHIYVRFQ